MKKITLIILPALLCIGIAIAAVKKNNSKQLKQGYEINVTATGILKNTLIKLELYIDTQTTVIDSLLVDTAGNAIFRGSEPLKAGMYRLAFPDGAENRSIDIFITDNAPQHFSISFKPSAGWSSLDVKGSPENELFAECMRFVYERQMQVQQLYNRLQYIPQSSDSSIIINEQLRQLIGEIKQKWNGASKLKGSTLALFIRSVQEIEIPEPSIPMMTANRDSLLNMYYSNYYKEHFFDNIDFSDERILNMPFLSNTLQIYFVRILPPQHDTMSEYTERLLQKAKANRKVYEYIVRNRYVFFRETPYPELESIAIDIAEKYVVHDSINWEDKAFVVRLKSAIEKWNLNPEGYLATDLQLQDINGNVITLYGVQSTYTVLYFFNPQCHTCSEVTPLLWNIYQQYKYQGVQVYAVYVDNEKKDWEPYIVEKKYKWINVWDADGSQKLYDKYDIHAIPIIYLLNENKIIVSRNLSIMQLKTKLQQLLK